MNHLAHNLVDNLNNKVGCGLVMSNGSFENAMRFTNKGNIPWWSDKVFLFRPEFHPIRNSLVCRTDFAFVTRKIDALTCPQIW